MLGTSIAFCNPPHLKYYIADYEKYIFGIEQNIKYKHRESHCTLRATFQITGEKSFH